MSYAIISLGGKQYRVREGEKLLVDRLPTDEGATFQPSVLMLGGDGDPDLAPTGSPVTARVVGHVLGPKIRIGKYKPKSGYRKHAGHRSRLSQIEIESIGSKRAPARKEAAPPAPEPQAVPEAEAEAEADAPSGYEGLKVTEIADWTKGRHLPTLESALAYEQAHGARKGAVAALEAAIAHRKEDG
jgi:large subunit ribosomal protein L21